MKKTKRKEKIDQNIRFAYIRIFDNVSLNLYQQMITNKSRKFGSLYTYADL